MKETRINRLVRAPSAHVVCALLCAVLAAGPAAADPAVRLAQAQPNPDEDDDTPTPPPPPLSPPTPGPAVPLAGPAPSPALGVVIYGPGHGLGYGYLYNPHGIPPADLYASGNSLRRIGMPLTLASTALLAISIGLLVKGKGIGRVYCDGSSRSCHDDSGYFAGGLFALAASTVGAGVGIPLWAVGSYRMKKAIHLGFVPSYARPYLAPTHGGVVAGFSVGTF